MQQLKRFLRQDRDYHLTHQADIQRQNAWVLRIVCLVYLLVLGLYTADAFVSGASSMLIALYIVFDAIHAALCVAVFCKPENGAAPRQTDLLRVMLELTLLSFFVLKATRPFQEQHAICYPFPIILLVMVFDYRARQAFTLIVAYAAVFAALSCLEKTGAARTNDMLLASGTLISAFAGYAITAGLRHETGDAIGRLRYLSTTDELTGLYNKSTFEALCRAYMEDAASARGYALLFIDVDKFKQINDRFGHQVGDSVLQSVAGVMRDTFYEKDYLCRFGGDEFLVFMADADNETAVREQVRAFEERVRALTQTLKTDGLSCSVGVAMRQARSESYRALLSRADAALYVVKRGGAQKDSFAEQYFKQNSFIHTDASCPPAESAAPVNAAQSPARRP